jgi:hypothetical protein
LHDWCYEHWLSPRAGLAFGARAILAGSSTGHFTPEEFDEVAAVLASSLDHFHVGKREKEEVLGAFASFKPAVTSDAILRA